MSLETNSFEFDEFLLDAREKVLLRHGKPLSITPKAFQLLHILVENHGHLVERNELLNTVWADSFVEEGNLTFTIRLLRKALDDNKQNPRFIETVPKRGYRFIAEVREIEAKERKIDKFELIETTAFSSPRLEPYHSEIQPSGVVVALADWRHEAIENFSEESDNEKSNAKTPQLELVPAIPFLKPKRRNYLFIPVGLASIIVLIIGVIFAGFWFAKSKSLKSAAPILSAPFASEKLSTNGKVLHAVVSPDGKNVVYTNGIEGKQSVWLRQLDTANNVEIIPPSDNFYDGLALSPDSNFLYFARRPLQTSEARSIFRISIFGGVPIKIISETEGWMSISPDGGKISFVRCPYRDDEYCSLWIADSTDGKNEKKLVSYPRPIRIGDNEISRDGKTIAFAVGQSLNAANEFGLSEIDIESGKERELTAEKFFNIQNLTHFPDRSGWLMTASKIPNKNFRIWQVSAATGEASPLTKDSETYRALSLSKDASVLVSTQVKQDFHLKLFSTENPSAAPRVLADATSAVFAPDGKIVFTSPMSGSDEIWSVNADGSGQRQLTNNEVDEGLLVVSPDGNSIFFASNRTGAAHVWRMNADGSSQEQITKTEGGFPVFVSPDGRWLFYQHSLNRTLWRVATKGGEEQTTFSQKIDRFGISPDGLQIAFSEKQNDKNVLKIISLADASIVKTFKLANDKAGLIAVEWSQDGRNLAYILADGEFGNKTLWFQPLDGKSPRQLTDLGNERITGSGFALAPDGKSFAIVQGGWRHDAVLLKGLK